MGGDEVHAGADEGEGSAADMSLGGDGLGRFEEKGMMTEEQLSPGFRSEGDGTERSIQTDDGARYGSMGVTDLQPDLVEAEGISVGSNPLQGLKDGRNRGHDGSRE